MFDLSAAREAAAGRTRATPVLPYGLEALDPTFELTWNDAVHRGRWRSKPARTLAGATRRVAPGFQGAAAAITNRSVDADVTLSIFENAGMGLVRARAAARSTRPHVMMVCWLAQDCLEMNPSQVRSLRRSLQVGNVSLTVFSSNQVEVLHERLGVPASRVRVVPFGVDTDYYTADGLDPDVIGGGGVLAVGSDSRRDYATLFDAVRLANVPVTLLCHPRNLRGLSVPPQVEVKHGVFDDGYRDALLAADLVVTPTTAPQYPSGQSVVLEAMAVGRPTLTTDSPAMRDYVNPGVDGLLVAPRAPQALAEAMKDALAAPEELERIGRAARDRVHRDFAFENLWAAVAKLLE